MKFIALLLFGALFAVGCDREGYKNSDYSKPMNQDTIQSTSGLDPDARIDSEEPRPPSESPGVKGSSSDTKMQDPDRALGTNAPPRNSEAN